MPEGSPSELKGPCSRDPVYYIDDGNIIIEVDNTIFKVHRSMLSKDQSIFEMMFSSDPQSRKDLPFDRSEFTVPMPEDGTSDDNPIRLHGDTVDEFRALLWSLYALPAEIALAMNVQPDDLKLVHLARISHKYQFKSTESWALQALSTFYSNILAPTSVQVLLKITDLAVLCDCSDLLNAVTAKWKRLLGEGRAVSTAIIMAERLNLRDILGLAYHSMMLKGRSVWDADPHLTRSQRIRLLSGHYTLSQMCAELPRNPPPLRHDSGCFRIDVCEDAWTSCWRVINGSRDGGIGEQVIHFHSADLLGKMMLAESIMKAFAQHEIPPGSGVVDGMYERCLKLALKATQAKVQETREGLVDWYSDVS